jgi:hypothetical protein
LALGYSIGQEYCANPTQANENRLSLYNFSE